MRLVITLVAMDSESTAILSEAYQRLHRNGPEFGGDARGDNGLTNHGPMAVEVICRRGLEIDVHRWLDRYIRRLTDLPATAEPVTDATWRQALGGGRRRVGDWTGYFTHQLAERPWRDVLATWWPRLLPGIAAGSTHGVIRVSHAVRTLLAAEPSRPAVTELAHGLAFWAARFRALPAPGAALGCLPAAGALGCLPAAGALGCLRAASALAAVPRLPDQTGLIACRLDRLARLPGWPAALRALRPAGTAAEVPARLAELVDAATALYLAHGAASPVLLVHTATAPNGVLHTLPALPQDLWAPSFTAAWTAAAALTAAYAPAASPQYAARQACRSTDPASDALARAARHADEHVLKFTDTAVDVYRRTGQPTALAAARHAAQLIDPP
jgi:hypothetical protein